MLVPIKFKIHNQSVIQSLINTQAQDKGSNLGVEDGQNIRTSRPVSLGLIQLNHKPTMLFASKHQPPHPYQKVKCCFLTCFFAKR
jgi:hypothetical protein